MAGTRRKSATLTEGVAWLAIVCTTIPALVFVSGVYRLPLQRASLFGGAYPATSPPLRWSAPPNISGGAVADRPAAVPPDKYLSGLLSQDFDEVSCLSRYQSSVLRKPSPWKPSPHLIGKLRVYEERHRRCGPGTAPYKRALRLLVGDGPTPEEETECAYVVWLPWGGLGNRILSIASTFLYALLTDRVMLIDPGQDMARLFCEPFPDTTWILPHDFPIPRISAPNRKHPLSYGNLLRNKNISTDGGGGSASPLPSFVYLYLGDDYGREDMQFYCAPDQAILGRVPWLVLHSDLYLVPGLFLNEEFEPELGRLFPEKETAFHHLGRYLFHPTNKVWGMVARYYKAYLAVARDRLGIQIRIFNHNDSPFEVVSKQVIDCALKEKLLPEVDDAGQGGAAEGGAWEPSETKSVLLTSLYSGYAGKIKDMYWEHPAAGGAVVSVHQPSQEQRQRTGSAIHDARAWAEINLLSLSDVLVTSAWSTFGYIAQGLAGIRPWILVRPRRGKMPEPACVRDISMEPCLHKPPWYVCRDKGIGDNSKVLPFVTHCVDVVKGLKLVNDVGPGDR